MTEVIHQFSGNKDAENRDGSNNKKYGQAQRSHIWPKDKPSLKKEFLQNNN